MLHGLEFIPGNHLWPGDGFWQRGGMGLPLPAGCVQGGLSFQRCWAQAFEPYLAVANKLAVLQTSRELGLLTPVQGLLSFSTWGINLRRGIKLFLARLWPPFLFWLGLIHHKGQPLFVLSSCFCSNLALTETKGNLSWQVGFEFQLCLVCASFRKNSPFPQILVPPTLSPRQGGSC